jgi:MYXO-CTERM domain-containing protein
MGTTSTPATPDGGGRPRNRAMSSDGGSTTAALLGALGAAAAAAVVGVGVGVGVGVVPPLSLLPLPFVSLLPSVFPSPSPLQSAKCQSTSERARPTGSGMSKTSPALSFMCGDAMIIGSSSSPPPPPPPPPPPLLLLLLLLLLPATR